jgi:hypothetical protein
MWKFGHQKKEGDSKEKKDSAEQYPSSPVVGHIDFPGYAGRSKND